MLAQKEIEEFKSDGVLIVRGLIDIDELTSLRERAEWIASGKASHVSPERLQVEPGVASGQARADTHADSLRKMSHIAFCDEVFSAHARNDRILDIVES